MSYTRWLNASEVATGLLIVTLAGCDKADGTRTNANASTSHAIPTATQGARVPEAEARLAAFLKGSLETSPPTETNALMACVPDGQTDRYLTLARFRVLSSVLRGDTVNATAEAVTVAEETGHPNVANKYLTNVRVQTDTLHWIMTRDSTKAEWGVCGYSKEGFGFGHYGSDNNTQWVPSKTSWAKVHQLAESLRTAR